LLAVWSALFLHERLTSGGLAGLGLIVTGLMVTGGSGLFQNGLHKPARRAVAVAMLTALLISIYSVIDGYAVKRGPAVSYGIGLFTLIPILVTPLILHRYPPARLLTELSAHWKRLAAIAVLGVCAYLMALLAYTLAPLSYAGAIREVSVVLGAFAGWRLLGEKMGGMRVFGAAVICAGILIIAWFG
jgi:drug/metabolite transporter (DMT)-like permease